MLLILNLLLRLFFVLSWLLKFTLALFFLLLWAQFFEKADDTGQFRQHLLDVSIVVFHHVLQESHHVIPYLAQVVVQVLKVFLNAL